MSVKKKRPQDAQPHQRCVMGDLGFSPTSRNRAVFSLEKIARFAERVPHGIACRYNAYVSSVPVQLLTIYGRGCEKGAPALTWIYHGD